MTADIDTLVAAHLGIWNSTDPAGRSAAMPGVYATDVRIGEPDASYVGHEGMNAAIGGLQGALPGMQLSLDGAIQRAQDMVTYAWKLGPDAETVVVRGRDVLVVQDGLIAALYVVIDA